MDPSMSPAHLEDLVHEIARDVTQTASANERIVALLKLTAVIDDARHSDTRAEAMLAVATGALDCGIATHILDAVASLIQGWSLTKLNMVKRLLTVLEACTTAPHPRGLEHHLVSNNVPTALLTFAERCPAEQPGVEAATLGALSAMCVEQSGVVAQLVNDPILVRRIAAAPAGVRTAALGFVRALAEHGADDVVLALATADDSRIPRTVLSWLDPSLPDADAVKLCACGLDALDAIGGCSEDALRRFSSTLRAPERGIITTALLIVALVIGSFVLSVDVYTIFVAPLERMTRTIRRLAERPLAPLPDDPELEKQWHLEVMLKKLVGLLRIGFGSAGAQIISQNLSLNGDLDPMVPGNRVEAIFGFCDIRNFTNATEVLQGNVMLFVNTVADILHTEARTYGGDPNKNVGDAFLTVWLMGADGRLESSSARSSHVALARAALGLGLRGFDPDLQSQVDEAAAPPSPGATPLPLGIAAQRARNTVASRSAHSIDLPGGDVMSARLSDGDGGGDGDGDGDEVEAEGAEEEGEDDAGEGSTSRRCSDPTSPRSVTFVDGLQTPPATANASKARPPRPSLFKHARTEMALPLGRTASGGESEDDDAASRPHTQSDGPMMMLGPHLAQATASLDILHTQPSVGTLSILSELARGDSQAVFSDADVPSSAGAMNRESSLLLREREDLVRGLFSLAGNNDPARAQPPADSALRCFARVAAALRHSDRIQRLFEGTPMEGLVPSMGYGLHFGWAIEGAVGSQAKVEATYLSPHVNIAARLETATRMYGVPLLMSGAFRSLIRDPALSALCRRIDRVTLKGTSQPCDIYTFDGIALSRSCFVSEGTDKEEDEDEETEGAEGAEGGEGGEGAEGADGAIKSGDQGGGSRAEDGRQETDTATTGTSTLSSCFPHRAEFDRAMELYLSGRWKEAESFFLKCGADGPSACLLVYIRSKNLQPPSHWQGYRKLHQK